MTSFVTNGAKSKSVRPDNPMHHLRTPFVSVFTVACLLAATGPVASPVGDRVDAGRSALAQRDIATARIEALRAIQHDADHPQARALLAEVLLRENKADMAELELRSLIADGAAGAVIYRHLAEALLVQGKHAELRELVAQAPVERAAKGELYVLAADSRLSQGRPAVAAELLDTAADLGADERTLAPLRARLTLAAGGGDAAATMMVEHVQRFPQDYRGWLVLGDIRQALGDREDALSAYSQAVELAFVPGIERVKRALLALLLGDTATARADYEVLKTTYANLPIVSFLGAILAYEREEYAEAETLVGAALTQNQAHAPSLLLGAAVAANLGAAATADYYAERFKRVASSPRAAHVMAAYVALLRGDRNSLAPLLPELAPPQTPYEALLADAMRSPPPSLGSDTLRAMAPWYPVPTEYVLDVLYPASDAAPNRAASAETPGAAAAASFEDVRQALLAEDMRRAKQLTEELLRRRPDSVRVHIAAAAVALAEQDLDGAVAAYERARAIEPLLVQPRKVLVSLYLADGRFEDALTLADAILNVSPDEQMVLSAALAAAQTGQPDRAREYLMRAAEFELESPRLGILEAGLALKAGEAASAFEILHGLGMDALDGPEYLQLYLRAAGVSGRHSEAIMALRRLFEMQPDSLRVAMAYASALSRNPRDPEYSAALRSVLTLQPDMLGARLALGRALLAQNLPRKAIDELQAVADVERQPVAQSIMAAASLMVGDTAGALRYAQRAFELARNNENLLLLAEIKQRQGDADHVISELQAWIEEHPQDLATLRYLGDIQLKQGRLADAKISYERALQHAEQPDVLNNLAWILKDEDPQQARQLIERAVELAPANAAIRETQASIEEKLRER